MATCRVQVILHNDSGVAENDAVNTFYFNASAPLYDQSDIVDAIAAFYSEIEDYMSTELTGDITIKLYDISSLPSGPPKWIDTTTMTLGVDVSCFPNEVALVGSFTRDPAGGAATAREKGRVFIGPLRASAGVGSVGDVRPDEVVIAALNTAMENMATDIDVDWLQHSETAADAGSVVGGWVDDAFDTQRRRGLAPSVKTYWP